jgi:transcriptional regulator with XRE-family HTH domain
LPDVGDSSIDLFYGDVGNRIKSARIDAGISQATLAQLIGFNRSSVANLEAGRQRIALHLFTLIAEALHADPVTLLPNIRLLGDERISGINSLDEHLEGALDTTQDFVRGAIAQVPPKIRREED